MEQNHVKWAIISIIFGLVLLGVLNFFYTGWVIRDNNQQWCDTLTLLDNGFEKQPPAGESGLELARNIDILRHSFRCQ